MARQELSSHKPVGMLRDDFQYILAIDIGTIYSGYAFANRDDIDMTKGNVKVDCSQAWNSGKPNLISSKTPTCILLDHQKNLVAFGFDAENKYCQIVNDKKEKDYYFFRRFKMVLYKKEILSDLHLTDEFGKTLPAVFVFGKCISALMADFFKSMCIKGVQLKDEEVRFVITVPAIWSDAAKQFMRQAANQAGIKNEQLLLALESEAASIYSQFVKSKDANELLLTVSKVGTRYLVADLGGGTADISLHEKQSNGFLKEIHCSRGDDCGGNKLNEDLVQEMVKNFGRPLMNEIKNEHPTVYFDVHREFEAAKKTVDGIHEDDMTMRLPSQFLDHLLKKRIGEDLLEAIEIGPHGSGVKLKYGTLYIKQSMVIDKLFQPTTDRIVELLKVVMNEVDKKDHSVDRILLVGGFSESKYIQKSIREAFRDKLVIVPESSDLCVLKGAVLFGHSPRLISHRVMRYTYGIETIIPFDSTLHDTKQKVSVEGEEYCANAFSIFVQFGTVVEIDTTVTYRFSTTHPFQRFAKINIFISSKSNPLCVKEPECRKIGEMRVTIVNPTKELRSLNVSLLFGNTEIQIGAKDTVTEKEYSVKLDFVMY